MFGRKKKKKLFQEMRKTAEFDSMRDMDDDEVDQFTVTDGDGSSEMGEYQGDKHDCFDEYQVAGEENCRESYDEKTYDFDVISVFSNVDQQMSEDRIDEDFEEIKHGRSAKNGKRKRMKRILVAAIFIAIIAGVAVYVMRLPYFKIREITISGNKQISKETVFKESGIKT